MKSFVVRTKLTKRLGFHFRAKYEKQPNNNSRDATSMIRGNDCDKIVRNYKILLAALNEREVCSCLYKQRRISHICVQITYELWGRWYKILFDFFQVSTQQLDSISNWTSKLQRLLDELQTIWRKLYISASVPWYLHFLRDHSVLQLLRAGSLSILSNQGFENSHQEHETIMYSCTAKGGGYSEGKKSPIEAIFLYQLRHLHLRLILMKARAEELTRPKPNAELLNQMEVLFNGLRQRKVEVKNLGDFKLDRYSLHRVEDQNRCSFVACSV